MKRPDLNQTQTRAFHQRAAADGTKREVLGVGVPLGEAIEVFPGFSEEFARDCEFEGIDTAKLRYEHGETIGVIRSHQRKRSALNIVARVSQTRTGDDALALAEDGVLSYSIGFRPKTWEIRDDGSVLYRHVLVKEFSLTADPAYKNAIVTETRSKTSRKETTMAKAKTPELEAPATDADALDQIRSAQDEQGEQLEDLSRAFAAFASRNDGGDPTPTETRSAAQILVALANNDTDTIEYVNGLLTRAYSGGTTADAPMKDQWVGDLTRLFDSSTGVLSDFFATGTLPDKGMSIEFGELDENTMKFELQENEGDDLPMGKVKLKTRTAKVYTYGGYTQLTRQEILRSTMPLLERNLEALTLAAGARKKAVLRATYLAVVTAREALADGAGVLPLGKTLIDADVYDWTDLVIDAAVRYSKLNLALDGMIVSPTVFKRLNRLEIKGHKVMQVTSTRDTAGTLDLTGINGDLVGLRVICDADRTGDHAEFANRRSIRAYDSALVQLQDENIINLSKDFSAYRFGANAAEIPAGITPVKFGA